MDERSSEKKSKRKKKVTVCIEIKFRVNNYEPRLPYLAALEINKKPGKVGTGPRGRCSKKKEKGKGKPRKSVEGVRERSP